MTDSRERPPAPPSGSPARSLAMVAFALTRRLGAALAAGDASPILELLFGVSVADANAYRRGRHRTTAAAGEGREQPPSSPGGRTA